MTPNTRTWLSRVLIYGVPAIVFTFGLIHAKRETDRIQGEADAVMAAATIKEKAVRAFADSFEYPLVILDSRGLVVEWNPATEKLTGYSFEEMVGKDINPIIPVPMREGHHNAFEAAMRPNPPSKEVTHGKTVGAVQRVYCQVVPKDPSKEPIDVCVSVRLEQYDSGEKFAVANIDRISKITELAVPPAPPTEG